MAQRTVLIGGVGLLAAVAAGAGFYASSLQNDPQPQASPTPAESVVPDAPPASESPSPSPEEGPVSDPAPVPETAAEAQERERWERRLVAEHEQLVEQAISAGCDASRADVFRQILADQRQARARTVEDFRLGKITGDELATQTVEAQSKADAAMASLLKPAELEALDPVEARAAVVEPAAKPDPDPEPDSRPTRRRKEEGPQK